MNKCTETDAIIDLLLNHNNNITSLHKLAERWNWTHTKVLRLLKKLTDKGVITRVCTPKGTKIIFIHTLQGCLIK